jgi:hypothetical protein
LPSSATATAAAWTIGAQFVGAGTFQRTPPAATTVSTASLGGMVITGKLTGTISPPRGIMLPTQLLNSQITASVVFLPPLIPTAISASTLD